MNATMTATKQATKAQIKKAVQATTTHTKFKIHAQGVTHRVRYDARKPVGGSAGAGSFTTKHMTKMHQNGRFSVNVWGRDADAATSAMIAGLTAAGYTVENAQGTYFEVHSGKIADLDGVLRWEGSY